MTCRAIQERAPPCLISRNSPRATRRMSSTRLRTTSATRSEGVTGADRGAAPTSPEVLRELAPAGRGRSEADSRRLPGRCCCRAGRRRHPTTVRVALRGPGAGSSMVALRPRKGGPNADADVREFLALTLKPPDGHARRLFRRQHVREASISVIRDLEEWVAADCRERPRAMGVTEERPLRRETAGFTGVAPGTTGGAISGRPFVLMRAVGAVTRGIPAGAAPRAGVIPGVTGGRRPNHAPARRIRAARAAVRWCSRRRTPCAAPGAGARPQRSAGFAMR